MLKTEFINTPVDPELDARADKFLIDLAVNTSERITKAELMRRALVEYLDRHEYIQEAQS